MEVKIKKLDDNKYSVNGKICYKDMNGNWIASPDMETKEVSHFQMHINAIAKGHRPEFNSTYNDGTVTV